MIATVMGLTDGAFAAIVAATIAAVGGCVSAYLTHRTRKENSEQHGESQRLMGEVVKSVGGVESAVNGLSGRIDRLDEKHDDLAEKVHRHIGTESPDLEED